MAGSACRTSRSRRAACWRRKPVRYAVAGYGVLSWIIGGVSSRMRRDKRAKHTGLAAAIPTSPPAIPPAARARPIPGLPDAGGACPRLLVGPAGAGRRAEDRVDCVDLPAVHLEHVHVGIAHEQVEPDANPRFDVGEDD